MRLERLEVRHFWSFGTPKGVLIQHFDTINVVIGRNNVGKSNLIRAIKWPKENHDRLCATGCTFKPQGFERFLSSTPDLVLNPTLRTTFAFLPEDWDMSDEDSVAARLAAHDSSVLACSVDVGFECTNTKAVDCMPFVSIQHLPASATRFGECCAFLGISETDARTALCAAAVPRIAESVITLSGWRRLEDPFSETESLSALLDDLKRAVVDEQPKRQLFDKVQNFFCTLTGLDDAQLDARKEGPGLNVTTNGRTLPLTSFGDGITHLLLMAAHAALNPNCVILIEEPETNLHPHLQRHLLQFLSELPQTQVVLTTHSPVLLDSKYVKQIVRVEHDGERSDLKPVLGFDPDVSLKQLFAVLDDIGARPSDVLQANVVIWVEGPSDRVFLKKCLSLVAPELIEGLHYQIVFYGGALRAHLSFGADAELLVDLLRLSRTAVMVCDSDAVGEGAEINDTKKRLKTELEKFGGFYWVTAGREIENYIPDHVLSRAYKALLEDDSIEIVLEQHQRLHDALEPLRQTIDAKQRWKTDYARRKVDLMRVFMDYMYSANDLNRYNLSENIDNLARVIARANDTRIQSIS